MSLNALIFMESYYFHVYSVSCDVSYTFVIGAIQVLRNADGGGGVSDFLEKSVTKV